MLRRSLPVLATLLLTGAGAALALVGVRTMALERAQAEGAASARARRVLEAVRAEVLARPPDALGAALRTIRVEAAPEAPWTIAQAPAADRLYLAEADYTEVRRGDFATAATTFARVAEATTDPSPMTRAYASLRAGILERRRGATAAARRHLEAAADLPGADRAFEDGTARWSVGPALLAARHLVALDLLAGGASANPSRWARLGPPAEEPGVLRCAAPGWLDRGDLLASLAAEAARWAPAARPAWAELEAAAATYAQARADLARLGDRSARAVDGVVVTGAPPSPTGRLVRTIPTEGISRAFAALAQAGAPGDFGAVTEPSLVPADAVALHGEPPFEGLLLWLRPRPEGEASASAARTVGAAWGIYLLGAGLAVAALRRSARAAKMQADFVAAVSHEMKTPIASVQAMAEMLAEGRVPAPERAQAYAERIRAEMARLGASVRDVLDAARIERDAGPLVALRPLEPGAVVTEIVEGARPGLSRRGFGVALEVTPARGPFPLDPEALSHVLNNLLDNASKYSGSSREVAVRAHPVEHAYRLEVLDRGPGVPPQERERIFERFVRGEAARRDALPGVGLGLHVARALVRAHGGRLWVEDREGGGARFVVELAEGAS